MRQIDTHSRHICRQQSPYEMTPFTAAKIENALAGTEGQISKINGLHARVTPHIQR